MSSVVYDWARAFKLTEAWFGYEIHDLLISDPATDGYAAPTHTSNHTAS